MHLVSAVETLRRPVPLSPDLSRAFARYATRAVAVGISSAHLWRLERHRDGAIWLTVAPDNERALRRERGASRRPTRRALPTRTRIAPDEHTAVTVLDEHTAALY